jgi:hypothetical protein
MFFRYTLRDISCFKFQKTDYSVVGPKKEGVFYDVTLRHCATAHVTILCCHYSY